MLNIQSHASDETRTPEVKHPIHPAGSSLNISVANPATPENEADFFRSGLVSAANQLQLPYVPGRTGGAPQLLVCLLCLRPDLASAVNLDVLLTDVPAPGRFIAKWDPLADLLIPNAFVDEMRFWHLAIQHGTARALKEETVFRITFRVLGAAVLDRVIKKLISSHKKGQGDELPFDSTQCRHVRVNRRILSVNISEAETCLDIHSVRFQLDLVKNKYSPSSIYPAALTDKLDRREVTLLDCFMRVSGLPIRELRARINEGEEFDKANLAYTEDSFRLHSSLRIASSGIGTRDFDKRVQNRQTYRQPCPVPPPGGISAAVLEEITQSCLDLEDDSDCFLAAHICGFCPLRSLPDARVRRIGEVYLLETPAMQFQPSTKSTALFHEPVSDFYRRPIPWFIAVRLKELDAPSRTHLVKRTSTFLKERFGVTPRALELALQTTGPSHFGYPWAIAALGFSPESSHPPGPLSYFVNDFSIFQHALDFYRRFDRDFNIPASLEGYKPCGSKHLPRQQELSAWLRSWTQDIAEAEENLRVKIAQEEIFWWNAIVSGAHALTLLLCGLRNYPISPPHVWMLKGYVETIYQKRLVSWYLPSLLRKYLIRIQQLWLSVLNTKVAPKDIPSCKDLAFGYLDPRGQIYHKVEPPCARWLRLGLLGVPELAPYSGFHPNFLRNYSYTSMRLAGFAEDVVRSFHGHSADATQALRIQSLNPSLSRDQSDEIAAFLADSLGL